MVDKNIRSLTNPVANVKMKAKVTEGNVDFILSLGYTTGFVKEPKYLISTQDKILESLGILLN